MKPRLPQNFGPYTLNELIARGGMAEIYRATMQGAGGFEKTVAIKKILPHLAENDEFITMLIDEAQIIVSINHANIAQVYDLGKIDEDYYIAMEFIHGIDLSTIVKFLKDNHRTVPTEHAVFIASSIVAGLHVAHNKHDDQGRPLHIVHRDVSPHNILISFAGDVKIIDFGVAKARGKQAHTSVGVIKGKLLYMAPEQAMAKPIDGRADLFAAGLILYRMLTNYLPFEGENEFQIYNNILSKEIPPPRSINPDIPEEVNQIVMMLLQRDPSKRYQDGYSAKVDLDRALHAISPGYSVSRLSRWVEDEFSHLAQAQQEKRRSGVESGQNEIGLSTPSGSAVNTGEHDAFAPNKWDAIDEDEDTVNIDMKSREAQEMLEAARRQRAAAGFPPREGSGDFGRAEARAPAGAGGSGSFGAAHPSGQFPGPGASGQFAGPGSSGQFPGAGASGEFGGVGGSGQFPSRPGSGQFPGPGGSAPFAAGDPFAGEDATGDFGGPAARFDDPSVPLDERVSGSFDSLASVPVPDFNAPLPESAPKRKIPVVPVIGSVVLLLAIAGMLAVALTSSDEPPAESPTTDAPPVAEAPEAAAEPVVEPAIAAADAGSAIAEEEEGGETVPVTIQSTPPGATIFLGEDELGVTPLETTLPKGEDTVELRVELEGHEPDTVKVIPFSTVRKSIDLEPIAGEEPAEEVVEKKPAPKKKTTKRRRSSNRKKTQKKTEKKSEPAIPLLGFDEPPKKKSSSSDDDVLNPFGD